MQVATEANRELEQTAPWKLMKKGQSDKVAEILYDLAERLRHHRHPDLAGAPTSVAWHFRPTAQSCEQAGEGQHFSLGEARWGLLPDGHVVGAPIPVFSENGAHGRGQLNRLACAGVPGDRSAAT